MDGKGIASDIWVGKGVGSILGTELAQGTTPPLMEECKSREVEWAGSSWRQDPAAKPQALVAAQKSVTLEEEPRDAWGTLNVIREAQGSIA